MNIETAREMLAAATAEPPVCTCSNPEIVHEEECRWLRWNYEMPPAMGQLTGQAPDAFSALILAMEAVEKVTAALHATSCHAGHSFRECGVLKMQLLLEEPRKALAAWEKL